MHLLLSTSNAGKIIEIKEVLSDLSIDVKTPLDFQIIEIPHEHGTTYAENALLKARFYYEKTGLPCLSDDSGIVVEALADELGVHTRRWGAGAEASDKEWISYFLQRMEREENKRARFVCCLAFIDEQGKEHLFEGTCDGVITPTLEADYLAGLPISACFKPNGFESVYSAMSIEQKNSTSHRGKALGKFKEFLRRKIAVQDVSEGENEATLFGDIDELSAAMS
jgi:XTP/dITP diphosphohydrolase